jgi:uncharacterized protein (TIGR02058 family)
MVKMLPRRQVRVTFVQNVWSTTDMNYERLSSERKITLTNKFTIVRACRNAIEFNSIPSIPQLVPGGYSGLKLNVLLAVPPSYQATLDWDTIRTVFPYGSVQFQLQDGGMVASSGITISDLGDTNDDMVVVCACVTVGY